MFNHHNILIWKRQPVLCELSHFHNVNTMPKIRTIIIFLLIPLTFTVNRADFYVK